MKKALLFACVCAVLLGTGCVSDPHVAPPQKEVKPEFVQQPETVVANNNIHIENEINTKLRVAFVARGESGFSTKLATQLSGSLDRTNVRIVTAPPSDLNIILTPEFEVFDKTGEYVRINCTQIDCSIRSSSQNSNEVYAIRTFHPENMPRQLGVTRAKEQYIRPAVKMILPFLNEELLSLSQTKLAVSDITFKLKNKKEDAAPSELSLSVNKISNILRNTLGVVNYQIVSQDAENARCVFRIAYLKDSFPQGLTNALNISLAAK